ncbi:hypothetical protein [Frankia alni]|uniref:hypothetical protein n=1 Tax=Frankia alni TaxID=1859 RepID=UPI001E3B53BA|nr:hypothetical protein [Frankia alni]
MADPVPPSPASSELSFAWSEASVAVAASTAADSAAPSRVASVCPASTWSPGATATLATVPETGKVTLAWLAGETTPVESSVCATVARTAVAVR